MNGIKKANERMHLRVKYFFFCLNLFLNCKVNQKRSTKFSHAQARKIDQKVKFSKEKNLLDEWQKQLREWKKENLTKWWTRK
jgi:hypothetical protein